MNEKKLQNKLTRACVKAGLSWASFSSSIEITTREEDGIPIDTAYWYYNEETKKERIVIRPEMVEKLNVPMLAQLIRHELMHKAFYRNISNVKNKEIMNYALDACIDKILFISHRKVQMKTADYFFPPGTERNGIACICVCTINSRERETIKKNLRTIFDELYWVRHKECTSAEINSRCYDNRYIPDPLNLYNKLCNILTKKQKEEVKKQYGAGNEARNGKDGKEKGEEGGDRKGNKDKEEKNKGKRLVYGGPDGVRATDQETVSQEKDIAEDIVEKFIRAGGHYSFTRNGKDIFDKYVTNPNSCDVAGLSDFIKKWETKKQIESVENTVLCDVMSRISFEPFPQNLSRTGLEYLALGVSGPDAIPLYLNEVTQGSKKKICCYFDTSPSMGNVLPFVLHLAEFLESLPDCEMAGGQYNGRYCFSQQVYGMDDDLWEKFRKGKNIRMGYGTSFESVIKHALTQIDEDDVDIIVVFTDGESNITKSTVEQFNNTRKTCYNIYMLDSLYGWDRGWRIKKKGGKWTSPLDQLNGKSFSIILSGNK